MAKHNAKGRSTVEARHVRLYHSMLICPAWLALTPNERCVYIEIVQRYNGMNNGFIAYSVREGADALRMSKNTVARCIDRLIEVGFLEIVLKGSFSFKKRHATEYRLADFECNRTNQLPSKAFMKWGREKRKQKTTVSPQTLTVPLVTPGLLNRR